MWPFQCLLLCGVGSLCRAARRRRSWEQSKAALCRSSTLRSRTERLLARVHGMVPTVPPSYSTVIGRQKTKISSMAARRPGGARYGVFLLLFGGMQLKIAHPLPLLDFARSPRQLFTFLSGLKKLLTRVGRAGAPHQSSGTLTAAWYA